jgi:hypothetical protein
MKDEGRRGKGEGIRAREKIYTVRVLVIPIF